MPSSASQPMPMCPMWWSFTDGRDTAPKLGAGYLEELEAVCAETGAGLATVCGRYWAMDRDKRWERIAKAYALLVNGQGEAFPDAQSAMAAAYAADITDEFVEPAVLEGVDGRVRPGMWSSASTPNRPPPADHDGLDAGGLRPRHVHPRLALYDHDQLRRPVQGHRGAVRQAQPAHDDG